MKLYVIIFRNLYKLSLKKIYILYIHYRLNVWGWYDFYGLEVYIYLIWNLSGLIWKIQLKVTHYTIRKLFCVNIFENVIYSCGGKNEFSDII